MSTSQDEQLFHQVVCRPALPLDFTGMLELTSQIWEGDDYVPNVWHAWLFDPEGLLAVAEFKGKVVGLGKLTKLSLQDWWLEGLRVHPQFEGRGVASRIHKYLLDTWEKIGSGTIRFATVSTREPVKHLAQVNGFHLAGEYSTFKCATKNGSPKNSDPFTQIEVHENQDVVDWFASHSLEWLPFGLLNLGWQFAPPQEKYLAKYLDDKQIWWWKQDRGVIFLAEKNDGSDIWGRVRQLDCDPNDLVALLSDTLILAARFGYAGITWLAPMIPGIEILTAEAGFQRDWESSLLVFEKTSSK